MDGTQVLVQLAKSTPGPAAALIGLYWFRNAIKRVFVALAFFISKRQFKTKLPGVSVETTGPEIGEVRKARKVIEATPAPPDNQSGIRDVIEARAFVLRDESGKARAEIGFVSSEKGKFPAIRIFNAEGQPMLYMGIARDNTAAIFVEGPEGDSVGLVAGGRVGPLVDVSLDNEKTCAFLKPTFLSVSDGKVFIGEASDGENKILVQTKSGQPAFRAP
jgi:hypothetical protein